MRGPPAPPFVGREHELASLTSALKRTAVGEGAVVVVQGQAGIGKTRLVDEALAGVRAGELEILRAGCGELERDVPFAAVAAALHARRSSDDPAIAALAELIGEPGGDDIRFRVVDDIVDILERRALIGPVVVVLDDVHRADPGSLLVVKRLARDAGVVPVGLICTRRSHPRRPEVDDALAPADVVDLAPLPAGTVAALAGGMLGLPLAAGLQDALAACGGNPLYAAELVRTLDADGRIDRSSGTADLVAGELPTSLRLTILAQLSFLSADAISVLRVASCFGTAFDISDLALVLDRPARDLLGVLDPAMRAGVLADGAQGLAFRHDLVRDAVYEDVPASGREALHADIAAHLRSAGRPATGQASHLLRSARVGDMAAVELLRGAARATAPLSTLTAAALLERAREVAPSDYAERHDLTLELAAALSTTGRQHEAEDLARGILAARPGDTTAQQARAVVVQALRARDRARDAVEVLEDLVAGAGPTDPNRVGHLALATRTWAQIGEGERALELAPEALAAAESAGDDDARCLTMWATAWALAHAGRTPELVAPIVGAIDIARHGAVSPSTRADVAWGYLLVFGMLGPLRAEARAFALAETQRAESTGHLWVGPMLHGMIAFDHVRWVELDDAAAAAHTAIRVADELGSARFLSSAYCTLARVATYLGNLDEAERCLQAGEALAEAEDDPVVGPLEVYQARAIFEEARGRPDAAAATLWEAFERFRPAAGLPMMLLAMHTPRLVRCLIGIGRRDDAADVVRAVEALDRTLIFVDEHAATLSRVSLHLRLIFDRDVGAAHRAVAGERERLVARNLFELLEDAAEVIYEGGARDEAVGMLEEARAGWEARGVPLGVGRVSARLRELGVRPGARGPRRRPTSGWDALTDAEHRVAELVADSLTYREIGERLFLSRRTVEGHVARIFTKLDLSSRRKLAIEVDRRRGDQALQ